MYSRDRDLRLSPQANGTEGNGALANLTVSRSSKERLRDLITEGLKPGKYLSSEYGPPRLKELPARGGLATAQDDLPFEKMRTVTEGTKGLLSRGLLDEEQVRVLREMAADDPVRCQVTLEAFAELEKRISDREADINRVEEVYKKGIVGSDLDAALVDKAKELLFEPGDVSAFQQLRRAADMIEFCDKVLGSEQTKEYLRVEAIEDLRKQELETRYRSCGEISSQILLVKRSFRRSLAVEDFQRVREKVISNIDFLRANNVDLPGLLGGLTTPAKGFVAAFERFNPEILRHPLTREQLRGACDLAAGATRISVRVENLQRTKS